MTQRSLVGTVHSNTIDRLASDSWLLLRAGVQKVFECFSLLVYEPKSMSGCREQERVEFEGVHSVRTQREKYYQAIKSREPGCVSGSTKLGSNDLGGLGKNSARDLIQPIASNWSREEQ